MALCLAEGRAAGGGPVVPDGIAASANGPGSRDAFSGAGVEVGTPDWPPVSHGRAGWDVRVCSWRGQPRPKEGVRDRRENSFSRDGRASHPTRRFPPAPNTSQNKLRRYKQRHHSQSTSTTRAIQSAWSRHAEQTAKQASSVSSQLPIRLFWPLQGPSITGPRSLQLPNSLMAGLGDTYRRIKTRLCPTSLYPGDDECICCLFTLLHPVAWQWQLGPRVEASAEAPWRGRDRDGQHYIADEQSRNQARVCV